VAKKKRSRRTSSTRQRAQRPAPARAETAVAPAQEDAPSSGVDFGSEYRYVLSDLRRFGILAVAMFATLVVLAIVLG
jgi:hypothetical protein